MATVTHFVSNGSRIIPVSDSSFYLENDLSLDLNQHELEIRFWDSADADTLQDPTAGTYSVQYSQGTGLVGSGVDVWRNFADGVAVDATTSHSAAWTPPTSVGSIANARITLNGIGTATYFTAWLVSK